MPPKNKSGGEPMKQKSLISFFGKAQQNPSTNNSSKASAKASASSGASSDVSTSMPTSSPEPTTPTGKQTAKRALAASGMASSSSSIGASTPPTSDPVDIDMLSSEDDQPVKVQSQRKRKVVVVDTDEEDSPKPSRKKTQADSSPLAKVSKKQKLSQSVTDDEDGDDDAVTSFSQRLTNFKKSPVKKGRKSRSVASDDDDFIVPSDTEEEDTRSLKSATSRSSSRLSNASDFDDDEEEEEKPKKGKASKAKASSKAKDTSVTVSSGSVAGNNLFLTAAEQRERGRKDEKKSAEEPYAFLQDVTDKDGRRPGEPNYDPRTLRIPASAWKDFTPFEKQFWEIKQNHYDTILFFQKGKFLELYEDDARIGHREFDLKMTTRVKMSMVGVPEMSFNFWAAKFLGKGYKVGRVDQAETALGAEMRMAADKSKGKASTDKARDKIVRRELNKVYTNGTLVDAELLTDDQAGHCISIFEEEAEGRSGESKFGICILDCATSQFDMSNFQDDICRTKLETLMRQLRPKELLFVKGNLSTTTSRLLKGILPAACLWTGLRTVEGFDYEQTLSKLRELYPPEDGDMDDDETLPKSVPETIRAMVSSRPAIKAFGSMIWYLRQLNIDKDILSMKNFNVYDPMKRGHGLVLDGQTLAHIEVLLNNEGTEDGSLLKLLGRCVTPSGKRLFRIWICMPLREISDINARLDAVQDLIDHPSFEEAFAKLAKGLPDLERIVSRVHAKNCRVKDFLKVLEAFKRLSKGLGELADEAENFNSKTVLGLLRGAPDLRPYIKSIEGLFVPPTSDKEDELVPREGKDEAYDNIMSEIDQIEMELAGDLKRLEKKVGFKLSYWHSAIGNKDIYLVEAPASEKNVPDDWTKSGGTKAKTRWLVRPLQGKIRQLKEARENRGTATKAFKSKVFEEFDTDRGEWLRAVRVLAELDCLLSLSKASVAIGEPACRPEFVEGDTAFVDFEELRHPTLSLSTSVQTFIPNGIKLGGDVGRITLLTGPNMAGKSTAMRMTATGVIMAQLGMLVPASRARLCPVESIITRMGAYDNMFSNSSTFKVELDEWCSRLQDSSRRHTKVVSDSRWQVAFLPPGISTDTSPTELGRGTSTYDGMAIAGAVLHQLATHTLPLAFFATHYGSLTDDFAYHPNIRTMHMSTIVDDDKRDIVFLFKLVKGAATGSFGTHVANLAGVPTAVVDRADLVSKNFALQFKERLLAKKKNDTASRLPMVAHADFAYLLKVATGAVQLPADAIRRRELLNILRQTVRCYVKEP